MCKLIGSIHTNVPKLLDVCKIRGNGRPARFLSDCTGETPMPPVRTKSLPAKGRWYQKAVVQRQLKMTAATIRIDPRRQWRPTLFAVR